MNKPEFDSEAAAMRDSMDRFARSLLLDICGHFDLNDVTRLASIRPQSCR